MESLPLPTKSDDVEKHPRSQTLPTDTAAEGNVAGEEVQELKRKLDGFQMQMIAFGGAVGAGLFVGSGGALARGGPASLVLCFMIIGGMIMLMMQALAELACLYPVNGAFYQYVVRFIDPSWGFAIGWEYAINWLTILPFEITAAGLTIDYWHHYNTGIWITIFLVLLIIIQFFGVDGYGHTEVALSMIKIAACTGFIIFGIVVNCGGIPTDDRGYIGARYWHAPEQAFRHGFKGFCSVFVTASFAFAGTELTGLAAAEATNPVKAIPKAAKQVFWRITFFYVVNLFILGLIVPSSSEFLMNSSGANTKASPFVVAIQMAGIKGLPSVMNAVITIAVLSVANSATYGSTRTIQAMAEQKMAPKFLAYVDKKGRPVPTVVLQLLFGLLAFINLAPKGEDIFVWLLALSGMANFFVYGSICLAHIRFRKAWKLKGYTLDQLPYKSTFGVWGSYIGVFMNCLCVVAQVYVAIWPLDEKPSAKGFFSLCICLPIIVALYVFWKIYSWKNSPNGRLFVPIMEIDVDHGKRKDESLHADEAERWEAIKSKGPVGVVQRTCGALF